MKVIDKREINVEKIHLGDLVLYEDKKCLVVLNQMDNYVLVDMEDLEIVLEVEWLDELGGDVELIAGLDDLELLIRGGSKYYEKI